MFRLKKKKNIYAIFDDGALIYNRETLKLEIFGNVISIICDENN